MPLVILTWLTLVRHRSPGSRVLAPQDKELVRNWLGIYMVICVDIGYVLEGLSVIL